MPSIDLPAIDSSSTTSSRMSTTTKPSGSTTTGRKISKRACDGCKIRKVKCSEQPPCDGCRAVGISCTFNKRPATRGPRKLRMSTIQGIAQAQQAKDGTGESKAGGVGPHDKIPVAVLVLQLCVYRLRMYSVWPVVKVEEIIASLQSNKKDPEIYALANAVGAATLAQLKLEHTSGGEIAVSGQRMMEECEKARAESHLTRQVNMNTLRTAFFLHIYHENTEPGGVRSLLYLRETITLLQMMKLDRESSYKALSPEEQQFRRRMTWLLFVTERGVSMLHKLPVVLKPNIAFPTTNHDDEKIFPAFQKLVNLFWIFDQSHAFDILQEQDVDVFRIGGAQATNTACLDSLQKKLQDIPITGGAEDDVQTADIAVTRQWMRAVLWRASRNHNLVHPTADPVTYCSHPFQIAKDFLEVIAELPNSAIEAHGLCMELKMFEISTSVIDAIASASRTMPWTALNRPRELLGRLHQILSSTRGGNQTLVGMLRGKIAQITSAAPVQVLHEPCDRVVEELDEWDDSSDAEVVPVPQLEMPVQVDDSELCIFDINCALLSAQRFDNRSYSESDLPAPLFEHRESASTTATTPGDLVRVENNLQGMMMSQQHQPQHFMPFHWGPSSFSNSQELLMASQRQDMIFDNANLGFYGQFQVAEGDVFDPTGGNRFLSAGEESWGEDGSAGGGLGDLLPELLPVNGAVLGWQ